MAAAETRRRQRTAHRPAAAGGLPCPEMHPAGPHAPGRGRVQPRVKLGQLWRQGRGASRVPGPWRRPKAAHRPASADRLPFRPAHPAGPFASGRKRAPHPASSLHFVANRHRRGKDGVVAGKPGPGRMEEMVPDGRAARLQVIPPGRAPQPDCRALQAGPVRKPRQSGSEVPWPRPYWGRLALPEPLARRARLVRPRRKERNREP